MAEHESRNPFESPRFLRWWLGSLIAGTGVVTDAFGPKATLISSGALAAAIGVLALVTLRRVRELR